MRLRGLFRAQASHERKLISSILPVIDTPTFLNAIHDRDFDTVHKCLLAGFSPNQADPTTKTTALHAAVECANYRAIYMLLHAGANVNLCDSSSSTPLHIAAYMGNEEIVRILLSNGADMFKQDNTGRNSFHLAASTGNNRLIQYFLSTIDNEQNIIHVPDAQNWTPLMCAGASNHPSTCAFLLSHGAYLNEVNDRGMSVFHIAAFLGSLQIIQELLTSSSDDELILRAVNLGDHKNQTPLFYACIEGHLDVALALLNAGANAYHLDSEHQTCLHAMLSTSIILKRHIRLFYRFIEYVDFRSYQDFLSRSLLDLAYMNQLNTIIFLLKLLNYKRNYTIISCNDYCDNLTRKTFSLRNLCIMNFKRSIRYHVHQRQPSQHELLEHALRQCFRIEINEYSSSSNELNYRKTLDDMTLTNKKSLKSLKKLRKTLNDIEQPSVSHSQSSWSIFTNKFKHQRASSGQTETLALSTSLPQAPLSSSNIDHPMKNLVLTILKSPTKLDDLLDFPSLINNEFIDGDMKTVILTYNLEEKDSSNQI